MASNFLSRLLPPQSGSPSIYETLRQHDEDDVSDVEERAGMVLDEENLGHNFQHFDLDDVQTTAADSHLSVDDQERSLPPADILAHRSTSRSKVAPRAPRARWMQSSPGLLGVEEADDEVPPSLLIEGKDIVNGPKDGGQIPLGRRSSGDVPTSESPSSEARRRWETARTRQRPPSVERVSRRTTSPPSRPRGPNLAFADPKDKAMWRWANIENLDNFLNEIYVYFDGNGIWSITLNRILNLLTLGFVVGFSVFLMNCIDYTSVPKSTQMAQIVVPRCMSKMSSGSTFVLWLFCLLWLWKLIQYTLDFRRLRNIHDFYFYLLSVSDVDLQTISWQEVVSRLMTLRDANPATAAAVSAKHRRFLGSQSKQRMDAHDIANRLMRKENYLIAMFNKEILDLSLPVPFLGRRQLLTKTLMWNIDHCILDFVFDGQGQVHTTFLKDTYRAELSEALRKRFLFAGFMNIVTAPFLVVYFIMLYFFQYFIEYQKNSSAIGSRQYTLLAKWKFREFNELPHLFKRRIDMSYPFATRYIDQFPKDKTVQMSRFISFIAGALASVLALATVIDPELFLGFEISPDRTVLFYLGIFGTIWAVSKGMVPEENLVFDPEYALQEVVDFTHYCPSHWNGRLHGDEVRREFAALYQMKLVIFVEEILSMIFTPFVLFFSLPHCSNRVIDFFREFTVHVDGLGYVCSFAVFDFKKNVHSRPTGANAVPGPAQGTGLRDDYYSTKDQKLEASYWGFMNDYARNPKTGIPFLHTQSRRKFNPPPPFPGLASPRLAGDPGMSMRHDRWDRGPGRPSPSGVLGTQTGLGQTAHYGGGVGQSLQSPLTSLLLDPHHQPSSPAMPGSKSVRPSGGPSKHSFGRSHIPATAEVAEETAAESSLGPRGTDTSVEQSAGDSHLGGETWQVNQAGSVKDEDEEGDDGMKAVTGDDGMKAVTGDDGMKAVTGDNGTGVLGMIKHFQKAQTDRRGRGGISI